MRGLLAYGFILLVLGLGSSSCDPCKRLAKKCDFTPDTVFSVRIDTVTVIKDSLVKIPFQLPPDTITRTVEVYIQGEGISPQRSSIESDYARLEYELSEDGELNMELTHKDTIQILELNLEDLTREVTILRDSIAVITETVVVEKKKIPGIGWIGIGVFISLVLFIVLKILGKI